MKAISYIDRDSGQLKTEKVPGEKMLRWLYHTTSGKLALHLLVKRKFISVQAGRYMNTRRSANRIHSFVYEHQIKLDECRISSISEFRTFNEFFYRQLKSSARPTGKQLVSPADGKILVFPKIDDLTTFFVKGLEFSLNSFLKNKTLVGKYAGGSMAIIRLAPADYHRFHFPASGTVSGSRKIEGSYFSVSPLALNNSLRIFCENKREYSTLSNATYGDILIAEVGATMVGSIIQTYKPGKVDKGEEKGYFAFGGSSLVLLFEEAKVKFDDDLVTNTQKGLETTVRVGETIAS